MKNKYYVMKRPGYSWFNGAYTHQVMIGKIDKILCVSTEWGAQVVADAFNILDELDKAHKTGSI